VNRASAGGVGVAAVAIAKEHRNKRVVSHRAVSRRVVRAGNRSANAGSTIECTPRRAKPHRRVMHPVMRRAVMRPVLISLRAVVCPAMKVASTNVVAVVEIVVNANRAVIVVPTERRASKAPAVIAEREAVGHPVIAGRVAIADLAAMERLAIGERVAIADLAMAIQERVEIADLAAMEHLAR
jgi:hypothetical protein